MSSRFTRNVAILIIGNERLVYFRERDADVDAIEEQLGQIIFQEGQIVNEHQANGESEAFYFR